MSLLICMPCFSQNIDKQIMEADKKATSHEENIGKADLEISFESSDRIFFDTPMIYTEEPLSLNRHFEATLKNLQVEKNLAIVKMGKDWSLKSQEDKKIDLDTLEKILKRYGFKLIIFLQGQNDSGKMKVLRRAKKPMQQVYAVIFGVTADNDGKLLNMRISNVMDTWSEEEAAIKVSSEYIKTAKYLIGEKHYVPSLEGGKPKEYFTYFYLDPKHPELVITDYQSYINSINN